ncbi:MAG: universal stress protein [Thermoplasmata archaeon]|nr:MAG: universal stress protein [Thermoplasmata archaeon]
MPYIDDIKFLKIMVLTSGPVPAEQNARYILKMARNLRADVLVVHVRDKGESREGDLALDIFDKISKELNVPVRLKPAIGEISQTIIEIAKLEEVNLIVMGATEGRNVATWIIDKIINQTDIPVVIIPWKYEEKLHKEVISA